MRLTTKGRLAVVAMIDLALHRKTGPVALAMIGRRQKISISYLEQMFADLRRHGLVASTRGPGGGYTVARDPSTISVADIVVAVDHLDAGQGRAARNSRDGAGADGERCLTPELWTSLSQRVVEFLDSVSLQKLVDDQPAPRVREIEAEQRRAQAPKLAVRPVKPSRPAAPNSVFELGLFLAR